MGIERLPRPERLSFFQRNYISHIIYGDRIYQWFYFTDDDFADVLLKTGGAGDLADFF